MRPRHMLLALAIAALPALAHARPRPVHIPAATLIAAAKAAPLKLIDSLQDHCDGTTVVGAWLTALTSREARRIDWTAGRCQLVNDLNPLDAGGDYCAMATVTLRHPKDSNDTPAIEIYLEDPKHGRIGPAYAFRAAFVTVDGMDYIRFRADFEAAWRERFPSSPPKPCEDE